MSKMDRRSFVKAAASVPVACGFPGLAMKSSVGAGEQRHTALAGDMDRRFDLTLQRVLHGEAPRYSEEFLLADVRPSAERRFTEYSGDLSGRYIGAMATAARVYGIEVPELNALVLKTIALQKPEGYFGSSFHFDHPTDADMALLWGNGRLLVGLLEYYRWRQSDEILASSKRIGDFFVRVSPLMLSQEIREAFGAQHFASSYICWTQLTEGLALLYQVTKDERYRALAEQIAAVIERRAGDHAHGYLTSLRGVADLYNETRDAKLLRQCEDAWKQITASRDLLITGGVPEGWSPNNHRTEGCGEADWVRLNLALWRATRDPQYLSMAEKAIFNEFAFNQFASGDYGHHVYTETGLPAAGAVRAWWCCTLHGLRCFPDIRESALRKTEDGVSYDLPVDGRMETAEASVIAESTLARGGLVRIKILRSPDEGMLIDVRKPDWADGVECHLETGDRTVHTHGAEMNASDQGQRIRGKAGDVVAVQYRMKHRSQAGADGRWSFWYGPWLLGAASSTNPDYFNELTTGNELLDEGMPAVTHPEQPSFSISSAGMQFRYAQAEYPDQPGTVILRPIAEQTGEPTTSWEVRFRRRARS